MNIQADVKASGSFEQSQREQAVAVRRRLFGDSPTRVNIISEGNVQKEIQSLRAQVAHLQLEISDYEREAAAAQQEKQELIDLVSAQDVKISSISIDRNLVPPKRKMVIEIIDTTLTKFPGVTADMVVGSGRRRHVVKARHWCIYAVYAQRPDLSLSRLGRFFGGRDHSTIINALKKIEAEMKRTTSPQIDGRTEA